MIRRSLLLGLVGSLALAGPVFAGEIEDLTGLEKTNILVMEIATTCWFLAIGCSVGSFLNVVAYRMPLGIPLGKPKSHCPNCKTPLGRRENLPVLGWLLLRGRCRHCNVAISPRYPLVEASVGGFFVALLFVELLSGGTSLPVRQPESFTGVVWILWYPKFQLIGLYLFHCFLLSVLTVIALIAIDRRRVPWSLLAWSLVVGVLFPVVWPTLHPVSFRFPEPQWLDAYDWRHTWTDEVFRPGWQMNVGISLRGLLDSTTGLLGGVLSGLALSTAEREPRRRHNVLVTFALVGTFLGWQASVSVAAATAIFLVLRLGLARLSPRLDVPTPTAVAVLTFGQLLAWHALSESAYWPGHRGLPVLEWSGDPAVQLAGLLLVLAVVGSGVGRLSTLHAADSEPTAPPS